MKVISNSRVTTALLFLGVVVNSGCLPSPGYYPLTPKFEGVVLRAGDPVARTRVIVTDEHGDSLCDHELAEATTNEAGKFAIAAVEEFQFVRLLFGDHLYRWHVCIDDGVSRVTAHVASSLGRVPPRIPLRCDLSAEASGGDGGFCDETDAL